MITPPAVQVTLLPEHARDLADIIVVTTDRSKVGHAGGGEFRHRSTPDDGACGCARHKAGK
jgi:hypothetical protein